MPNWDDQFDFDDLDNNKAKPKAPVKTKKTTNDDDQFFDDDNSAPKKEAKSMLPSINSRSSAKSNKPLVQTPKANPFANKSFGSKQMTEQDFEEDFEQEIAQQPKVKHQPVKTSAKQIKPTLTLPQSNQQNNKKQTKQDDYDEQFYEQQLEEPLQKSVDNKNKSKNSQKVLSTQPSNTVTKNQPQSIQPIKTLSKPAKQEEAEQYGEDDFQNDDYAEDDFEKEAHSPAKKAVPKVNKIVDNNQNKSNPKLPIRTGQSSKTIEAPQKHTSIKPSAKQQPPKPKQPQTRSQSVVPPKPPGNTKNPKETAVSSRNINKAESHSVSKPMKRSASRQSIRSNDNKSMKGSRISQRNESEFLPNKHMTLVAKSFPHDQDKLNQLSQLQINKINQKMRAMIRKFNEELNDLINKNMLLLKNKSIDKHLSLQERIRQLEIQKKSGETAIEVMQKDFDKLQGREGELREEEYQLILQKQIEQAKNKIKETAKQITSIKRQVDTKGKKLSQKQSDQHNAQNITHLKASIIQARKQQQKGQQRIQKLTSTYQQLQTKISDIDYKLQQLISQAKEKGVNIENTDHLNKKYEDLKNKLENVKNFNSKAESLNNTKLEILNHENDQVRISIRNINSQISNLYGSIEHSQTEAIKLIEKAKEKAGISPLFAESLDKLQKQLQQSRNTNDHDYFDARSEIKSRRSDSTKIRNLKTSNEEIEKSMPLRVTQSQNQILQNSDNSTAKPKFLKKKPQQAKLDIENKSKVNQRVWNQDSDSNNNSRASVNDENKQKASIHQNKQIVQEVHKEAPKEVIQQEKKDKSKPFMLKKNRPSEAKADEIKEKAPIVVEQKANIELSLPNDNKNHQQPKKQQNVNINLAPRMMRFNRKKNDEGTSQNNLSLNDNNSSPKEAPKPIQLSLEKKDNNAKLSLNLGGDKGSGLNLQIGEPVKKAQEQDKPVFVPKRFNLRAKADKKDDSYVPNVVEKDKSIEKEVKIQKPPIVQKEQKKQEYQPKFNFKDQEPVKNPFKKEPQQVVVEQPQTEIKPRFNLRLRDKQPYNNDSYEPSKATGPQLNLNSNVQSSIGSAELNLKIQSKPAQNEFIAPKQNIIKANDTQVPKTNPYNPYAPKVQPQVGIKQNIEPKKQEFTINQPDNLNTNNPYAAKFQGASQDNTNEAPKRQRGPLKKNKISTNLPKQSFNIYAQADDITNEVKEIGAKTVNQNAYNVASTNNVANNPAPVKNQPQKLNINDMLGIKKEVKKNDFSDLLGDVGVANTKNKKKNNDFFNDLDF